MFFKDDPITSFDSEFLNVERVPWLNLAFTVPQQACTKICQGVLCLDCGDDVLFAA